MAICCPLWFLASILSHVVLCCLVHVSGYQHLLIRRAAPTASISPNSNSSSLVASALVQEPFSEVSEGGGDEHGAEERLAIRGQEVVLECLVQGRTSSVDDGVVRWYHNAREISEDLRVTVTWSGRVILSHSVAGDSGIWQCARYGKEGNKIRLLVTIPPSRPFLVYGGAQLSPGARITTREGNAITVNCIVKGANPAPDITWMLLEEDLTPQSQLVSVWQRDEGTFSSVSNVSIASVDKAHNNKSIECVVRHPALPRSVHVPLQLNIEYAPDFRLRRWPAWGTPVRVGTDVIVLCVVDSNPTSLPKWLKEHEGQTKEVGGISLGGWLNLTQVTLQDRGWYKCSTSYEGNHFASHSVFINVQQGGPSSGAVTSSRVPQLQKTAYSAAKSGKYRCLDPETKTGDADVGDIEIRVPGSPVVTSVNQSIGAMIGSSVALTTHVCGLLDGVGLTWMPPSQVPQIIKAGQRYPRLYAHNLTSSGNPGCHFAVLAILGVESHDAGGWVAVAANSIGAHATLVTLNITAEAQPMAISDGGGYRINTSISNMVSKDLIPSALLILVMHKFTHQMACDNRT